MKRDILVILILCCSLNGFSQIKDTVIVNQNKTYKGPMQLAGRLGPCVIPVDSLIQEGVLLIINNVLITEKKKIMVFFERYKEYFKEGVFYAEEEAAKKWGIINKSGVFSFTIKKIIIDLD